MFACCPGCGAPATLDLPPVLSSHGDLEHLLGRKPPARSLSLGEVDLVHVSYRSAPPGELASHRQCDQTKSHGGFGLPGRVDIHLVLSQRGDAAATSSDRVGEQAQQLFGVGGSAAVVKRVIVSPPRRSTRSSRTTPVTSTGFTVEGCGGGPVVDGWHDAQGVRSMRASRPQSWASTRARFAVDATASGRLRGVPRQHCSPGPPAARFGRWTISSPPWPKQEDNAAMPIRAVWFDVGEALVDETREYGTWADWLGVPRLDTPSPRCSALYRSRPGLPGGVPALPSRLRPREGTPGPARHRPREFLNGNDVYPDVRPCLEQLRQAGYFVGIAGNQTLRAGRFIRELNLPADLIAATDDWGVAKPSIDFFRKLVEVSGLQPEEIVYVATDSTTISHPRSRQAFARCGYDAVPGECCSSPDRPRPQEP